MRRKGEERQAPPKRAELGQLASREWVFGNLDSPHTHIPEESELYERPRLVREALRRIHAKGRGEQGRIVETVSLEHEIGVEGCVRTTSADCVVWLYGAGEREPSRYVLGREGAPTDKLTLVLARQKGGYVRLDAAYLGDRINPKPIREHNTWENRQFWETHAIVLDDPSQIDPNRLDEIYLDEGDKQRKISFSRLNHLFEQKQRELLVSKTINHMAVTGFKHYVELETKAERDSVEKEKRDGLASEARRRAEAEIDQFVCAVLLKLFYTKTGIWPVISPKSKKATLNRTAKAAVGFARRLDVYKNEVDEKPETNLINYLTKSKLSEVETINAHRLRCRLAQAALKAAEQEAKQKVKNVLQELYARRNEPRFKEAASSWTGTPDNDHYIGPSGLGYSGGLVHFFMYRDNEEKRGRFKKSITEPMTVDGFIDFTDRLKIEVSLAEMLLENPDIFSENYVVILKDEHENRRYYILRPNNELIMAYQKHGQEPKLTTMFPNYSLSYLERVVEASLNGEKKPRMNKLGSVVKRELTKLPVELFSETASKNPSPSDEG
jgi:hypothetical protein